MGATIIQKLHLPDNILNTASTSFTRQVISFLEQEVINPLPCRIRGNLRPRSVDAIPIDLSPSRVDINLRSSKPAGALPQVATCPEEEHNGECEIRLEEVFSCADLAFVAEWV
jgi:hypothetical protein